MVVHTIHARPCHVKYCDPAIHALTAVIWHTALLPRAPLSNVSLPGSTSCTGRQLVALRSRHTATAQVATSVAGPQPMPLHLPPPAKAHKEIRGARAVVRLPVADGFWLPLAIVGKANRDLSPYVVSLVLQKALTEAYLQCFRNTVPTSLAQNTFRRKLFRMAVCLTCLGLSGGCTPSARQLQGTIWARIHLRAAQNRAWQNSSFEWRVQFDHALQTRCPRYLNGPVIYFRHSHGVEQGATCTFDGRLLRAMGAHAAPSGPAKALVGRSCARRQQNGAHVITLV